MLFACSRDDGNTASDQQCAGAIKTTSEHRAAGAFRTVDGEPSLWGHCECVDKDGDKIMSEFKRNDAVNGTYTVVHGTGKFAGLRGTRDYKATAFPAIPDGRAVCDEGVLKYELP